MKVPNPRDESIAEYCAFVKDGIADGKYAHEVHHDDPSVPADAAHGAEADERGHDGEEEDVAVADQSFGSSREL